MKVNNQQSHLGVAWPDGLAHDFHAMWLRESTQDPTFRDPRTGHKLQDADALALDVRIVDVSACEGGLWIEFSDGHRARYAADALRLAAERPFTQELVGDKRPFDGSLAPLPWHDLDALCGDPQQVLALLGDLAVSGFALVRGVPTQDQGSRRFLDLLGYTRITNNGDIEDIKALPDGKVYDLSMTPRALEPHVDNPYRVPQPGYTTLHCIRNDAQGGESTLIDGLHIATTIRRERPDLFHALASTPVVFRYVDDQAILENTAPFIDLDLRGEIRHIRYHGRCDQVTAADIDTLDRFYEARRLYSALIKSPANQVSFKLNPGEMFIVDNYRIFHARAAFRLETGTRHMQQAYIDRDVVSSRQKTLLRDIRSKPWKTR